VHERFKKIENFHDETPKELKKYCAPKHEDHGYDGPVEICVPKYWEKGQIEFLEAAVAYGYPLNLDFNDGNPCGVGQFPSNFHQGRRSTSATANLENPPNNLTIITNAIAVKVLLEGKKAVGIMTADGRTFLSKKEIIITSGCFDSPKLLLLSGIGPRDHLKETGIEVVHELPGVGIGLQDHVCSFISTITRPDFTDRWQFEYDEQAVSAARNAWATTEYSDKEDVPFTRYYGSSVGLWSKDDAMLKTPEYEALDQQTQQYLKDPSVPIYEILSAGPLFPPGSKAPEGYSYATYSLFLMNPQSRGSLKLKSSDPKDPPLIDPAFLNHPWDKANMINVVRKTMELTQIPGMKDYFVKFSLAPKSSSDKDIWEFLENTAGPVWHGNGTCIMGPEGDPMRVVDTQFKVVGLTGLRVADMSIAPVTPNNHTQSTAYLIGESAAEKLIDEYELN
jgi:choline dehydrogenase-like flavoprotein